MDTAKGWKKWTIKDVLENKKIDDQFVTLFREKKFKRLPSLIEVHVNKRNYARYIFSNMLCESTKDPLLIFSEQEIDGNTSPVSALSIFAQSNELKKTTLLLQELEPPQEMKSIEYVGHTKKVKGKDEKDIRVRVDKKEVGAVMHTMKVTVAGDRVYVDKWTVQAMNECEVAFERNKDIPQLISYVMLQPIFDKKAKEARMDAAKASVDFNVYLKKFGMGVDMDMDSD